jgi:hypothetical protein
MVTGDNQGSWARAAVAATLAALLAGVFGWSGWAVAQQGAAPAASKPAAETATPNKGASPAAPAAPAASASSPRPLLSPQHAATAALLTAAAAAGTVLLVASVLRGSLGTPQSRAWSLADALSEEVRFTAADGSQQTQLVASSSRLIAIFSLAVLLATFGGTAIVLLYALAAHGALPEDAGKFMTFLAGGSALFLPYVANQLRAAVERKDNPAPETGASSAKADIPVVETGTKGA